MDATTDVVTRLEANLAGRLPGAEISAWAIELLASRTAPDSDLIEEALVALSNLDHGDERLDTPREDLEFYRDCLLGKRSYAPAALSTRTD